MCQDWCDLLFAHWQVSPDKVTQFLPDNLQLDTFEGQAWLGVVPFRMANVHPRALPTFPWISNFLELNVRTYVTYKGKRGVFFFSLDASNPVAVQIARNLFYLPYFNAKMALRRDSHSTCYESIRTHQNRKPLGFEATYRPIGPVEFSQPASLEAFLTERYCLFVPDNKGEIWTGNIHHEQWPLQKASAEIRLNELGDEYGFDFKSTEPLLHYVEKIETVEWALSR
jgi:uncharacterized protein YqjF (DUF2071 family)